MGLGGLEADYSPKAQAEAEAGAGHGAGREAWPGPGAGAGSWREPSKEAGVLCPQLQA